MNAMRETRRAGAGARAPGCGNAARARPPHVRPPCLGPPTESRRPRLPRTSPSTTSRRHTMRHSPADRTTGGGRPPRPAGAHAGVRLRRSPHPLRGAAGVLPMPRQGVRECHRRRHMQGRRRPAEAGGRKTPTGVWRTRNAAWHGCGWSRLERSSTIPGRRRATSRAVPVFCFGESPTPIGSAAVPSCPAGVRPRGDSRARPGAAFYGS